MAPKASKSIQNHPTSEQAERLRFVLSWAALGLFTAALFYLCAFKIIDRDVWLHLKAGEIIVKTRSLIRIEPFAYTRAGLPFQSGHEYLFHILLYEIFSTWGAAGVILFRSLMVTLMFVPLLWIDRRSLWPNILLAAWAAGVNQPAFMDRPQLVTYVFFAVTLALALRYLQTPENAAPRF